MLAPSRRLYSAPLVLALVATGCHVTEHKDGANDNVSVSTPFGGMHVKTSDSGDTAAIGLTAYPGAVPVADGDDKDSKAANVDMSFGSFHLGVKAVGLQSADAPAKVLQFYRKDLSRYGDVVQCQYNKPVGSPTHTAQGLGCNTTHGTLHISDTDANDRKGDAVLNSDNTLELRAGSPQHEHIVSIDTRNGGSHIGLVLLDLPTSSSDPGKHDHDAKDSE